MVKRRNFNETAMEEDAVMIGTEMAPETTISENEILDYENILAAVQEIRKSKDIDGYILKSEAKATVDLDDPSKMVGYAIVTSQAFESSAALSSAFSIGDIETILIEGKSIKTLCINKGKNSLGIFMKKNVDDAAILQEIKLQLSE